MRNIFRRISNYLQILSVLDLLFKKTTGYYPYLTGEEMGVNSDGIVTHRFKMLATSTNIIIGSHEKSPQILTLFSLA